MLPKSSSQIPQVFAEESGALCAMAALHTWLKARLGAQEIEFRRIQQPQHRAVPLDG